jgi:hypothetical protein
MTINGEAPGSLHTHPRKHAASPQPIGWDRDEPERAGELHVESVELETCVN